MLCKVTQDNVSTGSRKCSEFGAGKPGEFQTWCLGSDLSPMAQAWLFRKKKNAVAVVQCLRPHFNLTCASNQRDVVSHKSARQSGIAIPDRMRSLNEEFEWGVWSSRHSSVEHEGFQQSQSIARRWWMDLEEVKRSQCLPVTSARIWNSFPQSHLT